jgi:hypothetical protein
MFRFTNINKPPMRGTMSGRQARGITKSGSPNLCQSCLSRPARVPVVVKGKRFNVCHDCAPQD